MEAPIHISQRGPRRPRTKKPTRVGHRVEEQSSGRRQKAQSASASRKKLGQGPLMSRRLTPRLADPAAPEAKYQDEIKNAAAGASSATRTSCRSPASSRSSSTSVSVRPPATASSSRVRSRTSPRSPARSRSSPRPASPSRSSSCARARPIGAHVTLRGDRAWEFLDRLVTLALPRIRDFRGLSPKQFDGNGNYTFGLHGAVDVPRDRPGQDRPRPRLRHHGRHDREDRRRGSRAAAALGFPFKEN